MIKFKTNKGGNGVPLIGLGLTARNIELLKERKPIFVRGSELGINFDIFIFSEPTEQIILNELHKRGFISDDDFNTINNGPDKLND